MTSLQLKFKSDDTDFLSDIKINGITHQYQLVDNTINIPHTLNFGFHLLEISITSLSPTFNLEIVDAILDGVSVKQTLYTMFGLNSESKKYQTTIFNTQTEKLWLPFINPIAYWIASCTDKIPPKCFASGLYERFDVYYPESIQVADHFPKTVKDFFLINLDFHLHEKTQDVYKNPKVPYVPISGIEYNESEVYKELINNLDYLKEHARFPLWNYYEKNETTSQILWSAIDLIVTTEEEYDLESKFKLDKNRVPQIYNLIKNLKLNKIVHAFIGVMAPGRYASPHIDKYEGYDYIYEKFGGCSQIYIPINFKPGNLFKLANVGLIPLDGPMLINNHNFVHSLINDSSEYRFAIAIVGSRFNDNITKLVKEI
jgi:hypothetical protein